MQRLTPEQIEQARVLKRNGVPKERIAHSYALLYNVHRTTVYRYISDNPKCYAYRKRAPAPPKEDVGHLKAVVQRLKRRELTSGEVADMLLLPLARINRVWL